jgi:hypothetical protein
MIMVAHPDELAFGVSVEPQKWVPTVDAWIERWKAERYALALIPPPTYDRLVKQGVPMQVIARDPRRVVVMKPLADAAAPADAAAAPATSATRASAASAVAQTPPPASAATATSPSASASAAKP